MNFNPQLFRTFMASLLKTRLPFVSHGACRVSANAPVEPRMLVDHQDAVCALCYFVAIAFGEIWRVWRVGSGSEDGDLAPKKFLFSIVFQRMSILGCAGEVAMSAESSHGTWR